MTNIYVVLVSEHGCDPYVSSAHTDEAKADAAAKAKIETLLAEDESEIDDLAVIHQHDQWQLVQRDVGLVSCAEVQTVELESDVSAPGPVRLVGAAAPLPGTPAFTMAVFRAIDVPADTKLFAQP